MAWKTKSATMVPMSAPPSWRPALFGSLLLSLFLATPSFAADMPMYVVAPATSLFARPSVRSRVLARLPYRLSVWSYGRVGRFHKVALANGHAGFVWATRLAAVAPRPRPGRLLSPDEAERLAGARWLYPIQTMVPLRARPAPDAAVLTMVGLGDALANGGLVGDHVRVRTQDGRVGFVSGTLVAPEKPYDGGVR